MMSRRSCQRQATTVLLSIALASLGAAHAAGDPLTQTPARTTVTKPAQTKVTQTPPQTKVPGRGLTTYVPPPPTAAPQLAATLTVDRNPVQVGENVTFKLVPVTPALAGRFVLTYLFDDGSPAIPDGPLEFTRSFATARDFVVRAGAVVKGAEIFTEPPEIARVTVTVTHARLTAAPPTLQAGDATTLSTVFKSTDPNIRYRFVTSNSGPASDWLAQPSVPLAFNSAGTYAAHVEIARLVNNAPVPIDSSDPLDIVVSAAPPPPPPPPPPLPPPPVVPPTPWWDHWWIGAIAALLVAATAGLMRGRTDHRNMPVIRPEFSSFLDRGPGTRDGSTELALSYLLVFDTAVADAQHAIDSNGQPLIASLRRRDA
jgi:hypothetical protein